MAVILYNPKAKNASSFKYVNKMKDDLSKKHDEVMVLDITQEKDLATRLKNLPLDSFVILMGGDGTLHHFVNTIYDLLPLPFPIYLSPVGSGNDFYRTLKIHPEESQLFQMTFNGKKAYFLNGMGIGIDGEIGYHVNQDKKKRKSTYLKETLKGLVRYQPEPVEVWCDGVHHTFNRTYLVVGSNGQYFGSGMRIAPKANPSNSKIDVVIAHNLSRLKILLIFLSIYLGLHTKFKKHVFTAQVSSLKVVFQNPKFAQMDGECHENVTQCEVSITPKKAAFRIYR